MEKKIFTQCETKLVSVSTEDVISTSAFDGNTDILGGDENADPANAWN